MSTADWVATACNPAHSVVVEACAGSGKTWLLTARLFRLLLAGVPAHRIVAITFTRKAAQEMHERLSSLLTECALADEHQLRRLLTERGATPDAVTCSRARGLAGQVLTDGRGVVIDTFHGWFASLCQLAPLSMGFSRQAEPTEHAAQWQQLAIRLYAESLVQAQETSVLAEQKALSTLALHLGQRGLQHVLAQALQQRVACSLWLGQPGLCVLDQHWQAEAASGQNPNDWPELALQDPNLPTHIEVILHGLRLGTAAQQQAAQRLLDAQGEFEQLREFFLTQAHTPRTGTPFKPTKSQTEHPNFCPQRFASAHEAVCELILNGLAMQRDWQDWQCTQALKVLLPGLFACYEQCLKEANVCDFDQLESVALELLRHPQERAYLLQKMDARAAHLLLDEFQDTNPVQWAIVRLWLEQYDASLHPTVFMVGDPKQSIYRFRRAEALLFGRVRTWLIQHFGAVALESNQTRRCQPGVVDVVNAVFSPAVRQCRTHFAPHQSLAPTQLPTQLPTPALYRYPTCKTVQEEALAVAQTLGTLHMNGAIKNLNDVLVLVHTRQTGHTLAQALRGLRIPFVVKDTGERYRSPLWDDTLALLHFLQQPHNNLALLTVLRSPLVGLRSVELQALANHAAQCMATAINPVEKHAQKSCDSVWSTLANLADQEGATEQPWLALYTRLNTWLHAAHTLPLLETLHQICGGETALEAYLHTAQPEQRDLYATHWNWLKGWVLGIQQGRFVNLQQAIDAALALQQHGASEGEVQSSQQGVRIMTIHGAKGLEAEHVWLFFCDEQPKPQTSRSGLVLDWPLDSTAPHSVTVMAHTQKHSPSRTALLEVQQAAFDDEADHLLYVALTRARTCLHVSNSAAKKAKRGWYARLHSLEADVPWPSLSHQFSEPNTVNQDVMAAPTPQHATWVYAEYPTLPPLPTALEQGSACQNIPQSPEQRMGQAWHAALEHLCWNSPEGFEGWWQARWADCEAWLLDLNTTEQNEVRTACAAVWHSPHVQAWFKTAHSVVLPELRWVQVSNQGHQQPHQQPHQQLKSLRADCVVVLPSHTLVLDYKWTVNESNLSQYSAQLQRYVACVNHTVRQPHHGPTKAALLDRTATIYPIELR